MSNLVKLKEKIIERPFGSMSKRELELTLLELLISESLLPANPAGLSREIRCTISKAQAYLTDLALRKPHLKNQDAIEGLVEILQKDEIATDGDSIVFSIHDAELRMWIEQSLIEKGLHQGQTIRRDVFKLSRATVLKLIFDEINLKDSKQLILLLDEKFGDAEWFVSYKKSAKSGISLAAILSNTASWLSITAAILQIAGIHK